MKKIFVFIDQASGEKGKVFLSIIQKKIPAAQFEICSGIEAFEGRLKRIKTIFDREIFILFADNEDRLNQLYIKKHIFLDKKIVMVIPDMEAETLTRVHRFYPRYFCSMDDKYDDFCDVLNKMLTR